LVLLARVKNVDVAIKRAMSIKTHHPAATEEKSLRCTFFDRHYQYFLSLFFFVSAALTNKKPKNKTVAGGNLGFTSLSPALSLSLTRPVTVNKSVAVTLFSLYLLYK